MSVWLGATRSKSIICLVQVYTHYMYRILGHISKYLFPVMTTDTLHGMSRKDSFSILLNSMNFLFQVVIFLFHKWSKCREARLSELFSCEKKDYSCHWRTSYKENILRTFPSMSSIVHVQVPSLLEGFSTSHADVWSFFRMNYFHMRR